MTSSACMSWPGRAFAVLAACLVTPPADAAAQTLDRTCPRAQITRITARSVVAYLSRSDLRGRAFSSQGEWCGSGLVAALFWDLGLAPLGSEDFFHPVASGGGEAAARNVVGVLPGGDPELAREHIVVGAHHDHVGTRAGAVYPGADDNASGVAALLLTAQALAAREPLPRSVLFVTFSGEETGFRGSRAFLGSPPVPLDDMVAMVNLDMVGRLRSSGLILEGWEHFPWGFRRALRRVRVQPEGTPVADSDGALFAAAGVPTVAFFTGYHADYHRPTDTLDRLDLRGIETIAELVVRLVTEWGESDSR
jgi:Zn-dependent M28 family amino/carboxypeptidase